MSPNDGEEKIKYYVLKEEVEQKIRYYAIKIEELLRDITILQNRWEEDTWKNEPSIFVTGKEITFPYAHEAKLFMEETQNTDITIRDSYPTYHINYKKFLSPSAILDRFMFILLLFLFLTMAYSVFVYMSQIGHGHNYVTSITETMSNFYMLFGLVFLLFYPFYVIYDWLPALYGGSMIKNMIDPILSYLEPIVLFPPETSLSSLIDLMILQTIFYTILSLIATTYLAKKYDLTFLYAIPLFFFTITLGRVMVITQSALLVAIFALIMQYIIFVLIYMTTKYSDSKLGGIAQVVFLFPFLPYLAGLGYIILFIFTLRVLSAHMFFMRVGVIKDFFVFRSKVKEYQELLNELGKELETYATLKKQSMSASQRATGASKTSQQSLPQEAKTPATQESQKAGQQQVSPQLTAQQSPALSTAQQVQLTAQQATQQTAPSQSVQQDTASQQIPQMISSQQITPSVAQQPSIKQIPQQQATSQASRQRLQHTPRADMLISNFEKALNQVKNIKGDSSEIYHKSIVLTYHSIIGIYLRKIYYGEPLKYHHLIQYFMVRGLISEELGKTLLDLSRKNWRLQNDPSFTANRELMLETMNATYQLLNELKNKKELLEKLLIEKKAHGGKLRL